MKRTCYIDSSIKLTEKNLLLIEKSNMDIVPFNPESGLERIEYLLLHSKLTNGQLLSMTNCKYIGIRAHNTDYVSSKITKEQNIMVSGLKTQHGIISVAEHTFALILGISKNLVNSHNNVAANNWKTNLRLNDQISGKTLGIIGYGKIGRKVAEIGKAFGMNVLVAGKSDQLNPGETLLNTVLCNSDVVTLHLSSGKENNHFINQQRLNLMKNDSILINTARGSVLDYDALIDELDNGKFTGVGLDVFDTEPVHNTKLAKYSNVLLTPHIGYNTKEALENMNGELISNFLNFLGND